jgi:electron transfer flavoprotein alpha subunit
VVGLQAEVGTAGVALDTADIVVCAGAGLGGPENLSYVYELAEALGGVVGGSRRVVDAGWLPRQQQIGLTGRVLSPQLYVGVAVRGAFNHTIGIQRAKTVVAINSDPAAPIFEHADFAVVGDYKDVVPALVEAVKRARDGAASPARP